AKNSGGRRRARGAHATVCGPSDRRGLFGWPAPVGVDGVSRSPFSAISALGSSVGRPHLARPRPTRLGSHDTEHFTARLVARRVSARTTPSISPLASPPDASRLALPP